MSRLRAFDVLAGGSYGITVTNNVSPGERPQEGRRTIPPSQYNLLAPGVASDVNDLIAISRATAFGVSVSA